MPNLDADLHNADWTRQEWDLPDSLEGLLAVLVPVWSDRDPQEALEEFLRLPAARAMPEGLRVEVEGLAASTVTFRSRNVLVTVPQRFHAGPGAHPGTGSPQQAHGGGGGGAPGRGGGAAGYRDGNYRWAMSTNPRSRAQVDAGMARVRERYPKLTEGVQIVLGPEEYGDRHPTSMAWVQNGQKDEISMAPRHIDSPDSAIEYSRESSASGGLVKVPDAAHGYDRFTVHEMGHIAEARLGGKRVRAEMDAAFKRDHGETLTTLIASSQKDAIPTPLAREVFFGYSRYATQDVHEFIAEAFTDGILNEEPSKFAETVMGVIDSLYAEKMGGDE